MIARDLAEKLIALKLALTSYPVSLAVFIQVGRLVLLKSDLVKLLSYLTILAQLGPVLGPPLGGFISTDWHWRWIFFINVPLGRPRWRSTCCRRSGPRCASSAARCSASAPRRRRSCGR